MGSKMKLTRRNFLGVMLAGVGAAIVAVLPKTRIAAGSLDSPYVFDDPEIVDGFDDIAPGAVAYDDIDAFVSRGSRYPDFDLDLRDWPYITHNQISEAIWAYRTSCYFYGPACIIITPAQNKFLMRKYSSGKVELRNFNGVRVRIEAPRMSFGLTRLM